jgi:hypothetical protein
MILARINQLGYLAGRYWLVRPIDYYREPVAALYDSAATDQERSDIQAAWAAGWRFGFNLPALDLEGRAIR